MDVIVGTAGHIDHGKTALVRALTGVDADRLPEEKQRGITVDIGFAELIIGDTDFGFVDVPGHERFVKNMLAGASGIDLVMLVIAADEGVMPQTREHFNICRLLGIATGVVVLTRTDLVDAETLELAKIEAAELVAHSFLADSPIICTSSKTGEGIEALKEILVRQSDKLPQRPEHLIERLAIDRSFSMKGFGAIATGTLASGTIKVGAEMQLLPSGQKVRIRGIQVHGRTVEAAASGKRVAVNLGGIDHSRVSRGMVLSLPDILRPTQIVDAEVEVLSDSAKPLRSRQRVRVHIGTAEILARIHVLNPEGEIGPGNKGFVQIRLETPAVAVPGEKFILRRYSPQATFAGGEIIDTLAARHRRKDLDRITEYLNETLNASRDPDTKVGLLLQAAGTSGLETRAMQTRTGFCSEIVEQAIRAGIESGSVVDANGYFVASRSFDELSRSAEDVIRKFHQREPLAKGISREILRDTVFRFLPQEIFQSVIASLENRSIAVIDNETVRLAGHKTELSPSELKFSEKLRGIFRSAGLEVPKLNDALMTALADTSFSLETGRKFVRMFLDSGELVKVTDEFYFSREELHLLVDRMKQFADGTPDRLIDVAKFKELARVSRKYAIPLLEYFDREKVTIRSGDQRLIR